MTSKLNNAAFAVAKRIIGAGYTIPVLGCALVRDNILYATNMDQQISHRVEGIEDGIYCIKRSFAIKEAVPENDIAIGDFPRIAPLMDGGYYNFDAAMIRHVSKFMSEEETRYYLNGIYFHEDCMVATDGHTLCLSKAVQHKLPGFIMPRDVIPLLPVKGEISIALQNMGGVLRVLIKVSDDYSIISKSIDGNYPDYKRAIPEDMPFNHELPFDWHAKTERVLKLAKATRKRVAMIKFDSDQDYGFNAKYLLRLPAEARAYYKKDGGQPARFDINTETYVLMPMRS